MATDPNVKDFLYKAVSDFGLDPAQEIDMNDPMTRLVMAIVVTSIEQGRDVYNYSEFIKGCAMSAGIDPETYYKEVNPTGLGIENNTNSGGFVSPAISLVVNGGPSVPPPTNISQYIQLGVQATLSAPGWTLGGIAGSNNIFATGTQIGQSLGQAVTGVYQGNIVVPSYSPPPNGAGYIPITADALRGLPVRLQNDKDFINAVNTVASDQNMSANDLLAVYKLESGFSTTITNNTSGATGLFQVIPSTAAGLGYTTGQIAQMTPAQQVMVHGEFLANGPLDNVENPTRADAYMANFYPYAVGKPGNFVIGSQINDGGVTARQIAASNPGLRDPATGLITVNSVNAALAQKTASIPYANPQSPLANVDGTLQGGQSATTQMSAQDQLIKQGGFSEVVQNSDGSKTITNPTTGQSLIVKADGVIVTVNGDVLSQTPKVYSSLNAGETFTSNGQEYTVTGTNGIGNQADLRLAVPTSTLAVPSDIQALGYTKPTLQSDGSVIAFNSAGTVNDPNYNSKTGFIETKTGDNLTVLTETKPANVNDYVVFKDGVPISAGSAVTNTDILSRINEPGFSGEAGKLVPFAPSLGIGTVPSQGFTINSPAASTGPIPIGTIGPTGAPGSYGFALPGGVTPIGGINGTLTPITNTGSGIAGYNSGIAPIQGTELGTPAASYFTQVNDKLAQSNQLVTKLTAFNEGQLTNLAVLKGNETNLLQQQADLAAKLDSSTVAISTNTDALAKVNVELGTAQADLTKQFEIVNNPALQRDRPAFSDAMQKLDDLQAKVATLEEKQASLTATIRSDLQITSTTSEITARIEQVTADIQVNRAQQEAINVKLTASNELIAATNNTDSTYITSGYRTEALAVNATDIRSVDIKIAEQQKIIDAASNPNNTAGLTAQQKFVVEQEAQQAQSQIRELQSQRADLIASREDLQAGQAIANGPTNTNQTISTAQGETFIKTNSDSQAQTLSTQNPEQIYRADNPNTGDTNYYKGGVPVASDGVPIPRETTVIDANTGQVTTTYSEGFAPATTVPASSIEDARAGQPNITYEYTDGTSDTTSYYRNGIETNAGGVPLGTSTPATPSDNGWSTAIDPTTAYGDQQYGSGGVPLGSQGQEIPLPPERPAADIPLPPPRPADLGGDASVGGSTDATSGNTASGAGNAAQGAAPGGGAPTIPPC